MPRKPPQYCFPHIRMFSSADLKRYSNCRTPLEFTDTHAIGTWGWWQPQASIRNAIGISRQYKTSARFDRQAPGFELGLMRWNRRL